jgi:outer membrane protein, heavy metal efflux system
VGKRAAPEKDRTLTQVAAEQPEGRRDLPRILERLQIPGNMPGGDAKPIQLPAYDPANRAERDRVIDGLYPPLESLGPDPEPLAGPEGRPLTLTELQRLALEKNPAVRQAAARVEAARGAAIQAGLPPNPTITAEGDTFGTGGLPGYEGFFIEQVIRLPNKLQLARAVSAMELKNAEVALRRAETDLAHDIRGNYFAVLVAQENVKVSKALVQFTTSVYEIQLDQLKGGIAAAYEPSLLRVSAMQARLALYQARNQYQSAWKTLAASLGRPGMAPVEVAGRLDIPVPVYDAAKVLEYAFDHHTDVLTARNALLQAKYQLRLAQLTPIPDPDLRIGVQNNYTTPPQVTIAGTVGLSFAIPIWDRNQGGIIQAQGNTVAASEQEHLVRVNLTKTLTTAYNSYLNNRLAVEMYRKEILPRQVQGYRALYLRFQGEALRVGPPIPGVSVAPAFGDLISSQGTLVSNVQAYVTALGALWQSVADVADVLQTNDLYQIGDDQVPTEGVAPMPDLTNLPLLPCCHPCAAPDAAFPSDRGAWHPVAPGWDDKPGLPVIEQLPKMPQADPGPVEELPKMPQADAVAPEVLKVLPAVTVTPAQARTETPVVQELKPEPRPWPPAYAEPLAAARDEMKRPVRVLPPPVVSNVPPPVGNVSNVPPPPTAWPPAYVTPTIPPGVPPPRPGEEPLPRSGEAPKQLPPPSVDPALLEPPPPVSAKPTLGKPQ